MIKTNILVTATWLKDKREKFEQYRFRISGNNYSDISFQADEITGSLKHRNPLKEYRWNLQVVKTT